MKALNNTIQSGISMAHKELLSALKKTTTKTTLISNFAAKKSFKIS
jgi:hypothetical protein